MPRRSTGSTRRSSDEAGAAMVEYAFLIALIAMVVAVGATALGLNLQAFFTGVTL